MNVLVVDDDDGVRNSLCGYIESGHHSCRAAKDGSEALEILKIYRPDLIIVDFLLPKITLIELTRIIRTEGRDKDTKIVLTSFREASQSELQDIAKMGVSGLIKKPVSVKRLREYLRSKQPCH